MPKKASIKGSKAGSKAKITPVQDFESMVGEPDEETVEDHDIEQEKFVEAVNAGLKGEDIYTSEGREMLEEDDEIEPWEEGFAKGAAPDKHTGKKRNVLPLGKKKR